MLALSSSLVIAQVGINNSNPNATLDVVAKTTDGSQPEGIIAPKLTGDQIQAADGQYLAAQAGAIVYATAAATAPSTKTASITGVGYYFFDGNIWRKIGDGAYTANNGLNLNNSTVKLGGALTEPTTISSLTATNKLAVTGTGVNAVNIASNTVSVDATNNRVGIGTAAPTNKLEINNGSTAGAVKIVDGTQADGRVLTSDANGVGTWKPMAFSSSIEGTWLINNKNAATNNSIPFFDAREHTFNWLGCYRCKFYHRSCNSRCSSRDIFCSYVCNWRLLNK